MRRASRGILLGSGLVAIATTWKLQSYRHWMFTPPVRAEVHPLPHNLLIVGCGTLGSLAGKAWLQRHPDAVVVAETSSTRRHTQLMEMGFQPRCRTAVEDVRTESPQQQFPRDALFSNVVFSVPPGKTTNYVEEVQRAVSMWDGTGAMVFTGSGAVYEEKDGGTVTEYSATAQNPTDRQQLLLSAEAATLQGAGNVVRFAGLYSSTQGPHAFWFKSGTIRGNPDGVVNLINYEDAAQMIAEVLDAKLRGRILLGCDDEALSRQRILNAAHQLPDFASKPLPKFEVGGVNRRTGRPADEKGRIYDNSATRELLRWTPRWRTFEAFAQHGAK